MVKDYDVDIQYHPGKANVVADALSRKAAHSSALITREVRVQRKFEGDNTVVATERVMAQLARLTAQPTLGKEWLPPNERIQAYRKSWAS